MLSCGAFSRAFLYRHNRQRANPGRAKYILFSLGSLSQSPPRSPLSLSSPPPAHGISSLLVPSARRLQRRSLVATATAAERRAGECASRLQSVLRRIHIGRSASRPPRANCNTTRRRQSPPAGQPLSRRRGSSSSHRGLALSCVRRRTSHMPLTACLRAGLVTCLSHAHVEHGDRVVGEARGDLGALSVPADLEDTAVPAVGLDQRAVLDRPYV